MTYLRSQSKYGAALGPEREQNVKVICNAFGVNPALAGRNEAAIAKLMHQRLGGAPAPKWKKKGLNGVYFARKARLSLILEMAERGPICARAVADEMQIGLDSARRDLKELAVDDALICDKPAQSNGKLTYRLPQ